MLYVLFLLSGLSGLIYQIVWVRVIGNVFGNTIYSASLVVAVFMLGLGVGSYLVGAWSDAFEITVFCAQDAFEFHGLNTIPGLRHSVFEEDGGLVVVIASGPLTSDLLATRPGFWAAAGLPGPIVLEEAARRALAAERDHLSLRSLAFESIAGALTRRT